MHCQGCWEKYRSEGKSDITLDRELMITVVCGSPTETLTEAAKARCRRASKGLVWEDDKLYVTTGLKRQIPPIGDRDQLVKRVAAELGYPGG
jgi:hypothetical protein